MEASGLSVSFRNRKFGVALSSYTSSSSQVAVKESVIENLKSGDVHVDNDGWLSVSISWFKIVLCFLTMMCTTLIWSIIMLVLLPWPYQRIRQGNIYGHVSGRILMWIVGNPIKIEGCEYSNEKAIYICNHASPIDVVLVMWLMPTGTVGIAKKEIIFYPLFGQLYFLANHIRIDRSNPAAAIKSLRKAANEIINNHLSLVLFPEGTRSKNGRLLPFKKGFVHLALQTRRPIVPVVFTGTHKAWSKGSLTIRPAPLSVKYLPPIRTDDWTDDKIEEYVKLVHEAYVKNLPQSQRPVPAGPTTTSLE